MRFLSRLTVNAGLLATTVISLTACTGESADTAAPILTTMDTSSAAETTSSTVPDQPTASPKKTEEGKENSTPAEKEEGQTAIDKDDGAKADLGNAPSGTRCGEINGNDGSPLLAIAITDGADCTTGLEMLETYLSPNPPGTMHPGSAAIWESPEGWMCSSRVIPPGFEDTPENRKIGCGPNTSERSVILLSPNEAAQYGL